MAFLYTIYYCERYRDERARFQDDFALYEPSVPFGDNASQKISLLTIYESFSISGIERTSTPSCKRAIIPSIIQISPPDYKRSHSVIYGDWMIEYIKTRRIP